MAERHGAHQHDLGGLKPVWHFALRVYFKVAWEGAEKGGVKFP